MPGDANSSSGGSRAREKSSRHDSKWYPAKRHRGACSGAPSDEREQPVDGNGFTEAPPAGAGCGDSAEVLQKKRSDELDVSELLLDLPEQLSHEQLARLLWLPNYTVIFILQLKQFSRISSELYRLYDSIRSSRGPADLLADRPRLLRLSTTVASVAREASQKTITFSTAARSISYLNQRVPTRVWNSEMRQRHLVHKEVAIKILAIRT